MRKFVSRSAARIYDEREAKLPAWARDTISALRREMSEMEGQLSDLQQHQDHRGSQVYWERSSLDHNPVYVPKRADVVYDFGGKEQHQDLLHIRWRSDAVEVMAGRGLDIKPQATNTIELRLRGY